MQSYLSFTTRLSIVNLLLLESQALKFWGEISVKYLQDLCKRLDNDLCTHETSNFEIYITVADKEAKSLQNILYLLPSDGGQIPMAFRNVNEKNNFSIDDDGFEVLPSDNKGEYNNYDNDDDGDY